MPSYEYAKNGVALASIIHFEPSQMTLLGTFPISDVLRPVQVIPSLDVMIRKLEALLQPATNIDPFQPMHVTRSAIPAARPVQVIPSLLVAMPFPLVAINQPATHKLLPQVMQLHKDNTEVEPLPIQTMPLSVLVAKVLPV